MAYLSRTFLENVALDVYPNIKKWSKIGYTPTMNNVESDVWSGAGVYVFPTANQAMNLVSGDNTNDIGNSIFSGTASGGSTTTLVDVTKNFNAGTPVAAGDCIILEKSGTTPEWGYVTEVTNNTTLTCARGFSSGGDANGRAYAVLDYSATTGVHATKIEYLDDTYTKYEEIVIMNGTTPVTTVNTNLYRINSWRVIACGSNNKPIAALTIKNTANTITYNNITAAYTRARNSCYTVAANKSLYVVQFMFSYGYSLANKVEWARLYTRANIEPSTGFLTGNIFYPYTEILLEGGSSFVPLQMYTKLPQKTDIKVSGYSSTSTAGPATVVLRGFLQDN